MAMGLKVTLAPYQVLTLVADTSSAITFDLVYGRLVLIDPDAAPGGGTSRRRLLGQVV
jgi:hypothetical protein